MAESEKPDSSTRKAKAKTTLLDDDISKDFLSSWKSMSVVGGNDMDFNFEPVAKGNKKAFDFGMDMDFSLDDAFGKMPSFKLHMPDIDFSSSSKTSSISKENKSEEESNKESRPEKNDKFTFSFDFNRFDDFQFDEPATKGGKNATGDKNSKQASSSYKIVCEDMPKQAASDSEARKEDAMHKELPKSEVAVSSKPGFLVEQERSLDVDQQKGTQISRDKTITVDALEPGPESRLKVETSSKISCAHARAHDFNSIPESNLLHMLVDSEEAYVSPETNKIMTAEGIEEDIHVTEKTSKQVFNEVKEQVQSTAVSMVKVSTQAISSDEEEVCSRNGKLVDRSSELETLREEFAANALLSADSKTLNSHRLSPPSLIEKMIISEEEKVVGAVVRLGNDNSTLDTVACSAINISQTLNSEVELNIELQKSGLKDTPAPLDSEPTPAKSILTLHKLSGANNFIKVHGINNGAGTKPLMLERSKKVSTPLKAVDSGERNGEKLGDNPSSCAKQLMKQDLAAEKREKNPDALWDGDSNENEDIQTNMVVDAEPRDGQAKKGGFRLLDNRKISIEVKPSGIQLPSLPGPERRAKSSNQGYWKIKDRISSIATVRKSNVGQVNRLSSARIDKLAPSLPSLRISRNITTNKQSSSSLVQDPKSMGNFEKSAMLQVKSKMASPVNFRKQSPSISSLKRKPTEAADLHSSKRLSPSENSMSKVSVREVENEVQTQRTLLGGSKKNVTDENLSPEFDFRLEANMENLDFTLMVESDANVEKAEVCAKELDDICSMLKKKHDEAKELLVRALVNNNNLLMLNHPICEEKIRRVQEFSSRLMSKEQEAGV